MTRSIIWHRFAIFCGAALARYAFYWIMIHSEGVPPDRLHGDVWEYVEMARAILANNWGHMMFSLRTPGYALLVAGLSIVGAGSLKLIMLLQLFLLSLLPVFGYELGYRVTARRLIAFLTGVILALDPAALAAELPIMSDGLAALFLTSAFLFLFKYLQRGRRNDLFASATLFALNLLTRPTALYFVLTVVPLAVWFCRRHWRPALVVIGICAIPVVLWTARNLYFVGIPAFSTVGPYSFLFYKAVSTEGFVTKRPYEEIALDYAREIEYRLGNPEKAEALSGNAVAIFENLYPTSRERNSVIEQLAREKLIEYLPWHLLLLPAGFDMFFRTEPLPTWFSPLAQIMFNGALLAIACLGAASAFRLKQVKAEFGLISLGAIFYFAFLTCMTTPGLASTRFLEPFNAFRSIYVSIGLLAIVQAWRQLRPASRHL